MVFEIVKRNKDECYMNEMGVEVEKINLKKEDILCKEIEIKWDNEI